MSDPGAERPERIRFTGTISDHGFRLIRWMPYRNSFCPEIRGTLTAHAAGTVVDVQLRKPAAEIAAVAVWLLVAALGFYAWRAGVRFSFSLETLFPIVIGLVLTVAFVVLPRLEVRKALSGLSIILGAVRSTGARDAAP